MKDFFKYGVILILTLLVHSAMIQEINGACSLPDTYQEECFVSLSNSSNKDLQNTSIHYMVMSCDLSHIDLSNIPTIKSFLRLPSWFREYKAVNHLSPANLSHYAICNSPDPVGYYVFGLRKIII